MLITSKDNNRIKEVRKLLNKKYSIEKGLFVIEGENLVEEAIKNNKSLKPIPNKAAKTKDSIYETFIYDGGN